MSCPVRQHIQQPRKTRKHRATTKATICRKLRDHQLNTWKSFRGFNFKTTKYPGSPAETISFHHPFFANPTNHFLIIAYTFIQTKPKVHYLQTVSHKTIHIIINTNAHTYTLRFTHNTKLTWLAGSLECQREDSSPYRRLKAQYIVIK